MKVLIFAIALISCQWLLLLFVRHNRWISWDVAVWLNVAIISEIAVVGFLRKK